MRDAGDQRWMLRLWAPQGGGLTERSLEENSCEELERATLTIVAMLVQQDSAANTAAPELPDITPETALEPEAETAPVLDENALAELIAEAEPAEQTPQLQPLEPPPQPPKMRGAIGFGGSLGTGSMPRQGRGGTVTPALVWKYARLELRAGYWASRPVGFDVGPDAKARFGLLAAALRGCGVPRDGRVEFPLCGGVEVGGLFAFADGFRLLHGPVQPWAALQTSAGLKVRATERVVFSFEAETWLSLVRARHRALGGEIAKSGRFGFRALLGAEFRFGGRGRIRRPS